MVVGHHLFIADVPLLTIFLCPGGEGNSISKNTGAGSIVCGLGFSSEKYIFSKKIDLDLN